MKPIVNVAALSLALSFISSTTPQAHACSRVVHLGPDDTVITARSAAVAFWHGYFVLRTRRLLLN